jgi:hypothetical protein
MPKERLATQAEVAEALRTTPSALMAQRYRGFGPPVVRVGGRVLYRWSEVDRWLDEHQDEWSRTRREGCADFGKKYRPHS